MDPKIHKHAVIQLEVIIFEAIGWLKKIKINTVT